MGEQVEINEELLYKILQVYEHATEEGLENCEKLFKNNKHVHESEADLIKVPNINTFARWSTIFKLRKIIKTGNNEL